MYSGTEFCLKGKNALVTGGAVGIGRACATALASAGANVMIVDLNGDVALKTVEKLKSFGVDADCISVNVADKEQVAEMMASMTRRFGGLDIAVNSAGRGSAEQDLTQSQDDWEALIGLNLSGVFWCAQAQAQQMIRQIPSGGKIINIASVASSVVTPSSAYNASKAAVVHLTRSLASHWGRFNINVNCVSPGTVMTPMVMGHSESVRQKFRDETPLGYLMRPRDITGLLLYLASGASDYMTGQELVLDGGYCLFNMIDNPSREGVEPHIGPADELVDLLEDLDAMGIDHQQIAGQNND